MLEVFLRSTIMTAAPLLLAALGELLVEESGVINVGIEGIMLTGAFAAMAAAYFTGSIVAGLCCSALAAVAMSAVFAVLAVNLAVNQVVAGTALDIFALGLTGVFYRRIFGVTGQALIVRTLKQIRLGWLARIPLLGTALFDQNLLVYLAFALVPVVWLLLYRTRYGLGLRAAGERPDAADAMGLGVYRLRWQAILISGVLTGLSGAYLTLGYANTFVEGMTAGRGFIALAIVILGQWRPLGVAAASVLFGAALALQFTLQAANTGIPYQLFLALPYVLTLLVLTLFHGPDRAPSALGAPYLRP
ncbi:MAG: ABC transporter permease [Candidatus Binataceae bacterium]